MNTVIAQLCSKEVGLYLLIKPTKIKQNSYEYNDDDDNDDKNNYNNIIYIYKKIYNYKKKVGKKWKG